MFLVAAAGVSAWLITIANIPAQLGSMLQPFMDNRTLLMVAMMALVLVVGAALDFVPTVLILTPVPMPIVQQTGIDPVYLGVFFIIINAIGLITPPVGVVLNVISGVARIDLDSAMRGVWPFLIAEIVVLGLLIFFPEIVTVPLAWLKYRAATRTWLQRTWNLRAVQLLPGHTECDRCQVSSSAVDEARRSAAMKTARLLPVAASDSSAMRPHDGALNDCHCAAGMMRV